MFTVGMGPKRRGGDLIGADAVYAVTKVGAQNYPCIDAQ